MDPPEVSIEPIPLARFITIPATHSNQQEDKKKVVQETVNLSVSFVLDDTKELEAKVESLTVSETPVNAPEEEGDEEDVLEEGDEEEGDEEEEEECEGEEEEEGDPVEELDKISETNNEKETS